MLTLRRFHLPVTDDIISPKTFDIEKNSRPHQQRVIHGKVEHKISTLHTFPAPIPASKSKHPGTDVEHTH